MVIYDNLYVLLTQFVLVSWKLKTAKTIFTTRWPFRAAIIITGRGNVNKITEKAKNVAHYITEKDIRQVKKNHLQAHEYLQQ